MKKLGILILTLSFSSLLTYSQNSIGSWQQYLCFSDVHSVEQVDDMIFAASDIGIFSYDMDDYILQEYTKMDELSDLEISTIAAIPNTSKLFIGYSNGNIDIFEDGEVSNIPDLEMKTMTNDKTINHVDFFNDKAYCSTSFGILVVDYNNLEISNFYYIGDEAADVEVYQITHTDDSIFVATESGLRKADINSTALSFYENWEYVFDDTESYPGVISIDDRLIIAKENSSSYSILNYSEGETSSLSSTSSFQELKAFDDIFAIVTSDTINLYYNNTILKETISSYDIEYEDLVPDFSSVWVDEDNTIWAGDQDNGLVKISTLYDLQILPEGPFSNECFKLKSTGESLWTVAGTFNHLTTTDAELSIYRDNKWRHITSTLNSELEYVDNFCDIEIDPNDDTHGYISSCNEGIIEIQNDELAYIYDDTNSGLQEIYIWELIGGIALDPDGNLYANNQEVTYPIVVKPVEVTDSAELWIQYDYWPYDDAGEQTWLREMIYTSWGDIWAIADIDPDGLFVFSPNETPYDTSDDLYRTPPNPRSVTFDDDRNSTFNMWDDDGEIIDADPQCIVEDDNNYIWVGTDDGVYVYYQPSQVFDTDYPVASSILVPRNDGSGLADYLLDDISVTCIEVDAANRKWIGTESNGAFLVSYDGTNTVLSFTSDNSSLISDQINTISIDPETGEVFFGTDKGIVSYMGTATEGEEDYSTVYAYPNPVKPSYEGSITVTGLIENSTVRITDISGKIVYQAGSTGGQLVWDGKNVFNKKVSSGIYLVFATNEDGSESLATKIMIVR